MISAMFASTPSGAYDIMATSQPDSRSGRGKPAVSSMPATDRMFSTVTPVAFHSSFSKTRISGRATRERARVPHDVLCAQVIRRLWRAEHGHTPQAYVEAYLFKGLTPVNQGQACLEPLPLRV